MFSDKIKDLRKSKGLTQNELGEMCGVSGVSVYKWETGRVEPDISNIKKLSEIFGVSVNFLLDIAPEFDNEEERKKIYDMLQQLPDEKLDQVLEYAKFLTENTNKKQENGHGA